MRKAIVTGGGGFVGLAVVRALLAGGVEPAVIGRNHYPAVADLGVRQFCGDIRDRAFLRATLAGYDTVFHVAAKAGIWGPRLSYYSVNVSGTENVIDACRYNNVPALVYTSTPSVVFNGSDLAGVDETTPYATRFLCHYAETKVIAEKMVLAANSKELATVALRPHLVWGPGDTNLIPRLVERGRLGLLKQVGDGKNLVDVTYIDNAAIAHVLAAENLATSKSAAGKAYFISQGEPVALWGFINELFRMLNLPPVTKSVSYGKAYMAGLVLEGLYRTLRLQEEPLMTRFLAEQLARSHWFSMDNARLDLGYKPGVSTAAGLKCLVDWLAEIDNHAN